MFTQTQRCTLIYILAVTYVLGLSSIEDLCTSHETGRNCSDIWAAQSMHTVERIGCAGMHLAYTAAMISASSYLDWDRDHLVLPAEFPFAFGPCTKKQLRIDKFNASVAPIRTWAYIVHVLKDVFRRLLSVSGLPLLDKNSSIMRKLLIPVFNIAHSLIIAFTKRLLWRNITAPQQQYQRRSDFRYNIIKPLWFFSDWKDGLWHDTEVLIACNLNSAYIIFRGSDGPADALTSSQTYIPAHRVDGFPGVDVGSLHRGFVNAYQRVNAGKITYLGGAVEDWTQVNSFMRVLHNAFQLCLGREYTSLRETEPDMHLFQSNYFRGSKCDSSQVNLSDVLSEAVKAGIENGIRVIITGHSLGGGLATLLTLDVLLNKIKTTEAEMLHNMQPSVHLPYDWIYEDGPHKYSEALQTKSSADNLFLITFGDPETADAAFFNEIFSKNSRIKLFADNNHMRFVSVSKFPQCKRDVVTGSLTYANSLFGDLLMGRGGGFWGRVHSRAEQRINRKSNRDDSKSKLLAKRGFDVDLSGLRRSGVRPELELHSYTSEGLGHLYRQGYLGDPIYVSSGHAMSAFAAHSVVHYVQGLTKALNSNKQIDCDFSAVTPHYRGSFGNNANLTSLNKENCMRCYMGCGLPAGAIDQILYSSNGCKFYDDDNIFFTLAC